VAIRSRLSLCRALICAALVVPFALPAQGAATPSWKAGLTTQLQNPQAADAPAPGRLMSRADFDRLVAPAWKDSLRKLARLEDSLATRSPEPLAFMGQSDAPLVVAVFEDYQCPFCARQETIAKAVLKTYADRGLVKVFYYDFPLVSIHPLAVDAAMYADCLRDQGKFAAARSSLFARQQEWSSAADPRTAFRAVAKDVGADADKAIGCYEKGAHAGLLSFGTSEAMKRGVNATPWFIVAGVSHAGGAPTADVFDTIVDEALRGTAAPGPNVPSWKQGLTGELQAQTPKKP
jgi:protein-disulfide isomerase